MREAFRSALAAARLHDDPGRRIAVIKRAVTDEVTAVDPTVQAHFTEYFNHSAVPDIVLRWPGENRERPVFVRPTGSANLLLKDMPFLVPHRPLVFALEDLVLEPDENDLASARESLDEQASAGRTWITDSSGTEAMSDARGQSPTLGLLSQALVRGGRGVSDAAGIARLTSETEAGFAGASSLLADATRSAVAAIEGHLDSVQSGRLTRLLRAVWEGHGGDLAHFPETATIGALTADDLSYLLTTTSEGPADFWRRIGRAVDTEMLGQARVADPSHNLQAFMSASLETLRAKGVRIRYEPHRPDELEGDPRWVVSGGCLAFRGRDWTAYIAARRADELPAPDNDSPPDLAELRRRARRNQVRITQVRLGQSDRVVTYESKDGDDVLAYQGLDRAAANFGMSVIEGAVVTLPGEGDVGIDFSANTAVGLADAILPLGALMRSVLPLLSDVPQARPATMRRGLTGDGYQPSLFEDDEDE
jgi:hypothetical protein